MGRKPLPPSRPGTPPLAPANSAPVRSLEPAPRSVPVTPAETARALSVSFDEAVVALGSALASSDPAEPTNTIFTSDHAALVVYADGQKVAQFASSFFATGRPEIIAALRACELCREVLPAADEA